MLLQFIARLLEVMTVGVRAGVEVRQVPSAWVGGNNGQCPCRGNQSAQGIAVVGRLSDDFAGRGQVRAQQPSGLRAIAGLPRRE